MSIRRRAWVLIAGALVYGANWTLIWYVGGRDLGTTPWLVIPNLALLIPLGRMARHDDRRAVVVGGHPASDGEWAGCAAVGSGQLPAEPREREAAISLARYGLTLTFNPWPIAVLFGLLGLMTALLALNYNPWCWVLAGEVVVLGAFDVRNRRRMRHRARALLMAG
jgi:hypothetical protein